MADLGNALLARLNELFAEDPEIDEIGLLFGVEAEDLTVENAFMAAEHKLGVAFSAGPVLFRAARTRFHVLNALLRKNALEPPAREELLACTRAVVLISADFYTAWNTRKEYVRRGWLDAQDEVTFTNLVFSLHPKSIDTWAYRRWLATRLCEQLKRQDKTKLEAFFQAQVDLCAVLSERHARNYHAWSFRHWIVSHFQSVLLERELKAMEKWCETHLKDHSGWNHRQHTLRCLLRTFEGGGETQAQSLLVDEFEFLSKILASYPQYEALWCHRRFVFQSLLLVGTKTVNDADASAAVKSAEAAIDVVSRGDVGDKGEDTEWLASQWGLVKLTLESALLLSAVQDLTIAWRTGNRFARRYALWLLERLRSDGGDNDTLAGSLNRLGRAMRAALVVEDKLLDQLWQS